MPHTVSVFILVLACVLALAVSSPSPALAASAPHAFTQPAASIRATGATLHGMAVPNGTPTQAWFEWGLQGSYSQTTPPVDIGSGSQVVHVSAVIDGLDKGAVYQQRLVVSNANAVVVRGFPALFTTGRRAVTWGLVGPYPVSTVIVVRSFDVVSVAGSMRLGLLNDGSMIAANQTPSPWGPTNVSAFAAGQYHTVELHPDGTVTASGGNTYGETNVPPGLTGVVAVAASATHSMALKADGTVVGWGQDYGGETTQPPGLSNVVAVACANHLTSAVRADGTVVAWGLNTFGQRNIPAGLSNVVAISSDVTHTVALRDDGTVICWGDNTYGQTNVPPGLNQVVAVAAGGNCTLALLSNAQVIGWGETNCQAMSILPGPRDSMAVAAGNCQTMTLASNQPPVAYAQEGSGPPGSDQVIQLSGWDADNDVLSFKIGSLPGRGTLYQCNNGVRGPLISSAGELVTDYLHRVVFAPGLTGLSIPYTSFSLVVNDGELDSPPGLVTINIMIPDPPVFDLSRCGMTSTTNPVFQVQFTGTPGATYQLWASTNLVNWQLLGNATSFGDGNFIYSDYPVTEQKRFYRAAAP